MATPPPERQRKPNLGAGVARRVLRGLVTVAFSYLALEAASFAALWITEGSPFSLARAARAKDTIIHGELATFERTGPSGGAGADWVSNKVLHPYLGFVYGPSAAEVGVGPRNLRLNSHGFFDEGPPIRSRSPEKLLVGIVGGSVAQGFQQSPAAIGIMQERLESSPHFAGRRVELVRLAIGGFHQPQQLLAVTYFLSLGAEFDIIVNIDGFNEVGLYPAENGRIGVFPAYPRYWHAYVSELPRESERAVFAQSVKRRWVASLFRSRVLHHSVTANLAWRAVDSRLALEEARARESMLRDLAAEPPYVSTGPRQVYRSIAEMMPDLTEIWWRSSLQLDRLCRAHGIEYFHFLQPNQYVPSSKRLTRTERAHAYLENHPYRPGVVLGYPMLREKGRDLLAEGVRFLDLSLLFQPYDESLYIDSCCHFGERGFEIVAEAIADAIVSPTRQ